MKILTQKELEELANHRADNCISIFIPTHRAGKEVNNGQDAIAFKNQIQKVKQSLEKKGLADKKTEELLEPLYKLHQDLSFWHQQLEGLAVFRSENHFSYHRLPIEMEDFCSVTQSFQLMPLIPLMSGDGLYHVLAISKNKVRLFEATRFYINEIDTEDTLQQGLIEVLKNYDFDKGVQNQSGSQGGGAPSPGTQQGGGNLNSSGNRGGSNFHGQGDNPSDDEHLLKEYFRNLNEGLKNYLFNPKTPLVIASVEYLQPLFREAANSYNYHLMPQGLIGNPDDLQARDLHKKSWKIVEPHFNREKERSRNAYQDLAGTGKTTYHLNEIVPAAFNGRIDSLFVAKGAHKWGSFRKETQDVDVHDEFQEGDMDLISKSAIQTILNGGQAFVVDADELPDKTVKTPMVALLRY